MLNILFHCHDTGKSWGLRYPLLPRAVAFYQIFEFVNDIWKNQLSFRIVLVTISAVQRDFVELRMTERRKVNIYASLKFHHGLITLGADLNSFSFPFLLVIVHIKPAIA